MKAFATIKTGYAYSKYKGWKGDYYTIMVIDGNKYNHYNILAGHEDIHPVKEYLTSQGYKEIFSFSVFGQVKEKDYKDFKLDTLEDIKKGIMYKIQ